MRKARQNETVWLCFLHSCATRADFSYLVLRNHRHSCSPFLEDPGFLLASPPLDPDSSTTSSDCGIQS